MPRGLNVIHLIGTVGGDAELRYAQTGTAVATFRLAVNRPPKDGQAVTDWFTIVCWGKLAEIADEHVRKGGRVYAHGRLQPRAFTDRQGRERVDLEVSADVLLLLDPKPAHAGTPVSGSPDDVQFDADVPF